MTFFNGNIFETFLLHSIHDVTSHHDVPRFQLFIKQGVWTPCARRASYKVRGLGQNACRMQGPSARKQFAYPRPSSANQGFAKNLATTTYPQTERVRATLLMFESESMLYILAEFASQCEQSAERSLHLYSFSQLTISTSLCFTSVKV